METRLNPFSYSSPKGSRHFPPRNPPVLVTRISTQPYFSNTASKNRSSDSLLEMSAGSAKTSAPVLLIISSTTLCYYSALQPQVATRQPSCASVSAIPQPILPLPTKTTATLFRKPKSIYPTKNQSNSVTDQSQSALSGYAPQPN